MSNKRLFLTILKAGKSRIMAQTDLASGEGLHFLWITWQRDRLASCGLLYKGTNPDQGGSAIRT